MTKLDDVYRDRWWRRVLQSRRPYFFERLRDRQDEERKNYLNIFSWFKDDIIYLLKWFVNSLIQIQKYGGVIRKKYNVSYHRQFTRMMYLAVVLRIRPIYFRKYRLFKQKNWEMVNSFAFAHAEVQREFSKKLFPEEIDLFLNKFLFHNFCKNHGVYSPEILAAYENGQCLFLKNPDRQLPKKDLFIKKMNGMMGHGAQKLVYANGMYSDKKGNTYDEDALFNFLKDCSLKKYPVLLQVVIKNHSSWMGFTSGALSTCRIVTCRYPDSQKIEPLFAAFRMPVGKMDVDNFSAGGLAAPVNTKNGILGKAVSSNPIQGNFEFTYHPDTNQKIEDAVIPGWNEMLDFAFDLHKKVRSAFVGWDISLTEQGWCVVEGSLEWSLSTFESPYEAPFKNTVYPVLHEQWMEEGSTHHV